MECHKELNDVAFVKAFESFTLMPQLFNHEAHLRLAWIHINRYGIIAAQDIVVNLIKSYVVHFGADDKYHHTLTIAAIRTVYHFYQKTSAYSFDGLLNEFPRLKFQFKELIDAHYSEAVINSEVAKYKFVEPDLLMYS